MSETTMVLTGLRVGDECWLPVDEFAQACGVDVEFVALLVDEGVIAPAQPEPEWRFGSDELARVRRLRRLQRDFDASLQSAAVMLDLLDEIDRLRGLLLRAGLRA